MRNWMETKMPRRLLSLVLSVVMVLSLLPMPSFAAEGDGLCEHHPAHTPECGYVAAVAGQPCTHVCGDDCLTLTTACTHVHEAACYGDAVLPDEGEDKTADACAHICSEESGCVTKTPACVHTAHDEACGYVEAVEGQPCGFVCAACAGEPQPEEPTDKVITGWAWVDPEKWLDETGSFAMPGVTEDTPAFFEDVVEYLPTQITADGETLTLGAWVCNDYPMETGTSQGEYVFQTTLPAGCILSEGGNVLRVGVTIAPLNLTEGPEAAAYDTVTNISYLDADGTEKTAACTAVTADYLSANNNTLSAGWYVAQGDVTIGSRVTVSGDVHLILADGCNLIVNGGIQVEGSNALTIYAQSTAEDTMGKLTAQIGGSDNAAIGGGHGGDGGTITINGGYVTATSYYGAAIGGGYGDVGGDGGTITISGGVVKATSEYGAAIGGGYGVIDGGSGGAITINGGVVQAKGVRGAAIGGGGGESDGGSGGTITINGGVITANSGDGAAIGGGFGNMAVGGSGGTITISGGGVKATSEYGAAIGGGYGERQGGSGGTITISGGVVQAESINGAAIGGGHGYGVNGENGSFSTGTSGNAVIFASSIADQSGKTNNAWSGIIFEGDSGTVYGDQALTSDMTIDKGKTLTVPDGTTLTIPAGVTLTNNGTIVSNGTIENNGTIVNNGTITGNQHTVSVKYLDADGTEQAAACTAVTADYLSANNNTLSAGWYVVQGNVTTSSRVTVSGDVHLILADGCDLKVNGSIQVQDNSTGSTPNTNALTLYAQSTEETTMGKLTTQNVDAEDAAIGGGYGRTGGSGGTITINGGVVKATSEYGAAIGGGLGDGNGGSGGKITINGGVVKAESTSGSAIGGGSGSGDGGSGGEITINGGVVQAESEHGAAIGGGYGSSSGGSGGEITINGGVVKAESTYGAAIGGGSGDGIVGDGGEITINGGVVQAESSSGAGIGSGGYGGSGDSGSFSTGTSGNAVIFASSIAHKGNQTSWSGVIFEGQTGKVYGSPTLSLGLPIPENQRLTLDMNGNSLTFAQGTGITLNSDSTLTLSGPGSFPNGISVSGGTLGDLLAEGWAFTQNGKYVPVSDETTLSEATNLSRITVTITTQPTDVTMTYGEAKSLSVTATPTTSGDTVTYQWYLDGSALTGQTQSTLSLSTLNVGTYQVYCAVTCDGLTVDSDTATVTVAPGPNYLDLTGNDDFDDQTEVWVDGVAYPIQTDGNRRYVALPSTGDLLTIFTYANGDSQDVHEKYPTGMAVYTIDRQNTGATLERITEFDDLLQYSGCSIRVTGKRGIRMITALTKDAKKALKKGELAGYTLEEYGTVVQWADTLAQTGASLTLDTGNHNYAYKRGKADPVFANVGELTQYTNVLVWESLSNEQLGQDIVMRPYIILKDRSGNPVTLYGGTVSRSIGYIAYQNRAVFDPGTDAYSYVWDIIHAVYGDQYDGEYQG